MAANAASFGGDLNKSFLTAGVSCGGNLTNAVSYLARDEQLQLPLTGSLLMCTGMPNSSEERAGVELDISPRKILSWDEHMDLPISGRQVSQTYGGALSPWYGLLKMLTAEADLAEPDYLSSIFTPFNQNDHSNLPPLYYQACGLDTWRDSAILYKHLLEKAGGAVKLDIYPGLPHTFWAFYPQVSAASKWAHELVSGTKWLLGMTQSLTPPARL